MKLIVWSGVKVEIGEISIIRTAYDDTPINQPALVIREATKEEYKQSYIDHQGPPSRDDRFLEGLYFYEVSTD